MTKADSRPTIVLTNVDDTLLRQQTKALTEINEFLTTGEPCADTDAWPDALEGLLNLLAEIGAQIDRQTDGRVSR